MLSIFAWRVRMIVSGETFLMGRAAGLPEKARTARGLGEAMGDFDTRREVVPWARKAGAVSWKR
jgi:hypothetical protein